jgi:hypothetical protein
VRAPGSITPAAAFIDVGQPKALALSEENKMEEFPLWLKFIVWGTIGFTALYTIWGVIHSFLQA